MSRRAIASAAIVIAAFALYAPTINDYFTQDDFGVVGLFSQRSLALFPRWFVSPWTEDIWGYVPDEIRPFPAASYVITSWFGAAVPAPNHILNIAIHAVNGLLVMWIAEAAAGLTPLPAAFAGIVFVLLPIHAESVAWVTGRVDSLPAFFYFASFLLYVRSVRLKPDTTDVGSVRLQPGVGSVRLQADYWLSVALFFAALFTKQNTITLLPALVAYDLIAAPRVLRRVDWARVLRYVPYAVLTIGFLVLRYSIFHEVARESTLSAQRFDEFLSDSSRHLVRLVFGGPGLRHWMWRDTLIVALLVPLVLRRWRAAVYFAVIWTVLGMAPILVSGYYSPRHMYLAALGFAVTLGIAVERDGRTRVPVAAAAAAIVVAYAFQLHSVVREWDRAAGVSRAAVMQIEREAATQPEGTLVIAGVPRASWAFAIPHSVRPPFTATDVTRRIFVISDTFDHCCDAIHWNDYTRTALQTWHARPDHPPVVALYWNERTGRMTRVSSADEPQLRTLASLLLDINSRESLDSVIRRLVNDYVALR